MMKIKTMKAAILTELKKPLVIDDVELPESLLYGQVLVKVEYSSICGSQLGEINGVKGHDPYLPHLLGHEGSGTVIEIGEGVKHVKVGDNVVMHWKKGLGIESAPPSYTWKGQKLNAGFVTTFNEYAVVSENRVTAIPNDFDMATAPLFGCAVTTGFGVINNNAKLKIGESVLVFGAGGVGLNIVQAASMTNAYPIVAVDLFENRLEMAKKFGAHYCFTADNADEIKDVMQKYGFSGGFDVAIDNTGNPEIIRKIYDMTASDGRTILVGVPAKGKDTSLYTLPLHFGKVLTGSFGGEALPHKDIPAFIRLYRAGKLKLDELITHRYNLSEINDAILEMRSGDVGGRCLVKL